MIRAAWVLLLGGCGVATSASAERAAPRSVAIADPREGSVARDAEIASLVRDADVMHGGGITRMAPPDAERLADRAEWPRVERRPPPSRATESEGPFTPVCVGATKLPKERPHTAACCYLARESILRPLGTIHPALRACTSKRGHDVERRVLFSFRIEQSGSIERVCSSRGTTLEDADAVRCMLENILTLKFSERSDADVALCGLTTVTVPMTFEP